MISVVCGLTSAVFFAMTGILGQRASRVIGELSAYAWAALWGLALTAIPAAVALLHAPVSWSVLLQLLLAGVLNVAGLVAQFSALRRGLVSMVVPISSAEGAVAALAAAVEGARLPTAGWLGLGAVVVGIAIAAATARGATRTSGHGSLPALMLAIAAAVLFGIGLFVQGHVATHIDLGLAIVPPSAMGTALVWLPMAGTRRLSRPTGARVTVAAIALVEVLGFAAYLIGARHSLPVTAVLSAQYATIAVLVSVVYFGERPERNQLLGYALVIGGVALLSVG